MNDKGELFYNEDKIKPISVNNKTEIKNTIIAENSPKKEKSWWRFW